MSNYIDFEFDGVKRGWKFSQATYALFRKRTLDMTEEELEAFSAYHLLYAGLKTNCVVKGIEFTEVVNDIEVPLTFEKVCTWADTLTVEQAVQMVKIFNDEMGLIPANTGKKKPAKKK